MGQGLGAALERLEQFRALEEERAALNAFVAFTEAVGSTTEVGALGQQGTELISSTLSVDVTSFELDGETFVLRGWSSDVPAELLARSQQGYTLDQPSSAEAARLQQPLFVDGWDGGEQQVPESGLYGAVAFYPFFHCGEMVAMLIMATPRAQRWSARDQAVFKAVGRSLSLGLDRAGAAERLRAQNTELAAHAQALDGFAELTRDLALESEPEVLIRQALNVVHQLLPGGYVTFQQPEDGVWRTRVQIGDRRSPELQRALDKVVPFASANSLLTPWTTGQPMFQDAYTLLSDGLQLPGEQIRALATLPIMVQGRPHGVLVAALFGPQNWAGVNRVVLETVVRSLEQAVERAQGAGALVERSRELQAANSELEAFSYSVSHDLRTPVRHVKGFSELARKALDRGDTQQALEHMLVVEKAALRMNTLIDAMLDLSRTSQQELRIGAVDLDALVHRAMQDVEQDRLEGRVTWNVAPLPTVQGDQGSLQQVINNLLANAVKYSRTRPEAVIDVWAEETPGHQTLHVRNNGVGFSPVYRDRLFRVFQRLHTDREFEGTGVGLAIVQWIILRHRGSVFADGVPDQGATFGFSLPNLPRD